MKIINSLALLLIIVGGINWGLWALFQFDLVAYLFGGSTTDAARVVYGLVGIAAVYGSRLSPPLVEASRKRVEI